MAESDDQLLERYRAGDEAAFEALVRRHQKIIYNLAYRMLENHADAADLAQRTFVQAFLHHQSFRRESSVRTWLYQICINLCRNAIRDRAYRTHEDIHEMELAGAQDVFAEVAGTELKERLGHSLKTLPTRQKEALVLRVYHERAFDEIGAIMSCSEGTAKANYHHAVDNLRRAMASDKG